MAKLLSLDAYIARRGTHENVQSLGKWNFGVCVDTGLNMLSGPQIPANNYDFFVGAVDDIYMFGGAMQSMGTEGQRSGIQKMKQYVPAITEHVVSSAYNTSDYELKLVNAAGNFAVKGLTVSSGAAMYTLYKSDGTLMNYNYPIALSGSVFSLDNDGASWGGLLVSGFAEDGTFSKTAKYYGFSINSDRYWNYALLASFNYDDAIDFLNNIQAYEPPPTDPYENGGFSTRGGGQGLFNNNSDTIPDASIPTINAVDCGLVTLYNPTLAQIQDLAAYLWSPLFSVETLKKLFADPMDIILGLNIVPVAVPDGGTREVVVGGFSTGVSMTLAAQQYVEVDCGSIEISEFYDSCFDYSPYTRIQLYLPFIGSVEINPDEVMGRTLTIKYFVDILTGSCIARVLVATSDSHSNLNGCLYQFAGHCGQSIPVTGSNYNQLIANAVSLAVTAISAGAGAVGGAVAAAGNSGAGGNSTPGVVGDTFGKRLLDGVEMDSAWNPVVPSSATSNKSLSGLTVANVAGQVAGAVMGAKPSITHTGSISSAPGQMGVKYPFLVITRPRQSLPESYWSYEGYPSNQTLLLSDCSGYTQIEQTFLENMPCSNDELAEIYDYLKQGVVI